MRKLILALPLIFLPTSAFAGDQPNPQGCYEANWFYPFLDLPSVNCTHPALGDPDHTFDTLRNHGERVRTPEPPPHQCPYPKE